MMPRSRKLSIALSQLGPDWLIACGSSIRGACNELLGICREIPSLVAEFEVGVVRVLSSASNASSSAVKRRAGVRSALGRQNRRSGAA
jgi:hypothetical protein